MKNSIETMLREKRFVIAIELLIVILFQALHVLRIIPTAAIFLFALGWLSLRLRKMNWKQVGFTRPENWLQTIGIGILAAILFQMVSIWLIVPLIQNITNETLDLSQFEGLRSNFSYLIIALIVSWTYAAFIEELVYRGYLLNRFKDLFGETNLGWFFAVLISSILFGLGHVYQGTSGVVETFLSALLMSGLYFVGKRNLWIPIIAHGVKDTIGFALIFLGLYP
ncbi:MAG: CPBP family intramembrane metalloprotease [Anaerolineales bacterium]|nr:CPBP family intramembrane metalloprotease [Anaerolineales bacterium]MBX3035466.1 CPBP family intramembrane metalloprotease [Anaerolineales bacterium]